MPQLSAGQTASIILAPADSYTVSASATTTVKGIYGAPSTTTTLTANFQTFGPYGVPAKLDIACVSGGASYSLVGAGIPATLATDPLTGVTVISGMAVGKGVYTESQMIELDTSDLLEGDIAYVQGLIDGLVEVKWNGKRFIPSSPVTIFSSGAGWARRFDAATDTTKVAHLAVPIPRVLVHEKTVLKITHYWSEEGASTKNLVLGISNTDAGNSFYAGASNSGTGWFSVQEVFFTDAMIYPLSPNQAYGSGGSANGPASISVDFEQELDLIFYSYANANLTSAESISLRYVKVEVL